MPTAQKFTGLNTITTPDGSVKFVCDKCAATLASTVVQSGYRVLKLHFVKKRIERHEHTRNDHGKGHSVQRRWDVPKNCQKCGHVIFFSHNDIAKALGYEDLADFAKVNGFSNPPPTDSEKLNKWIRNAQFEIMRCVIGPGETFEFPELYEDPFSDVELKLTTEDFLRQQRVSG